MSKDFSQQAEEQLQNAISSVEPCNDYEFTNYNRDGWCYYSEWINRLGFRNSINAVNSYQHKVTSKNENAKRKVSDIYEKENFALTFQDKLSIVVQRIYQHYKGYSSWT